MALKGKDMSGSGGERIGEADQGGVESLTSRTQAFRKALGGLKVQAQPTRGGLSAPGIWGVWKIRTRSLGGSQGHGCTTRWISPPLYQKDHPLAAPAISPSSYTCRTYKGRGYPLEVGPGGQRGP